MSQFSKLIQETQKCLSQKGLHIYQEILEKKEIIHLGGTQFLDLVRYIDRSQIEVLPLKKIILGPIPISEKALSHFHIRYPQIEMILYLDQMQNEYPISFLYNMKLASDENDSDAEIFLDYVTIPPLLTSYEIRKIGKEELVTNKEMGELHLKVENQLINTHCLVIDEKISLKYFGNSKELTKIGSEIICPVRTLQIGQMLTFIMESHFIVLDLNQRAQSVLLIQTVDQNQVATKQVITDRIIEIKRIFEKNQIRLDRIYFVEKFKHIAGEGNKVNKQNLLDLLIEKEEKKEFHLV